MKRLALLATLCVLTATTFAVDDPPAVTLQEATETVLYGGAEEYSDGNTGPITESPGSATNYCQSSMNSFGTMAIMGHTGSLSISRATFALTVTGAAAKPQSWGMFTRGVNPNGPNGAPFYNGYLCINPFPPGIFKFPTQHLGNGNVSLSMEEHPELFDFLTPGSTWYFQFWYRDPPDDSGLNLSDGLKVVFAP